MNALLRYPGHPMSPSMVRWQGHGAKWAWWCVYDILQGMGIEVTALPYRAEPNKVFDVVYSMQDLHGLSGCIGEDTISIVRLTSADPYFNNRQVVERTNQVNARRGTDIEPRRLMRIHDSHYYWLETAQHINLIGNKFTRGTFPDKIRERIFIMDNAAGNVNRKVAVRDFVPEKRAWLWHAGSGAIHKGLDLVLEAFARHPEWELHVTGDFKREHAFMRAYNRELTLPNVHNHGWMIVSSDQFRRIVSECVGFVLPTCAESQSSAAATCLTLGLYPVISKASGIDLPDGCGLYLDELTVNDVEAKVAYVMNMTDAELLDEVGRLHRDALWRYSRERFRETMTAFIKEALGA